MQAEVLRIVHKLHRVNGMTILFISHDLVTVRKLADRIGVMHRSRLIEEADSERISTAPEQQYTRSLLERLPRNGQHKTNGRLRPLDEPAGGEVAAPAIHTETPPVLQLEGLGRCFGDVVAVRNVSLRPHRGETVGSGR